MSLRSYRKTESSTRPSFYNEIGDDMIYDPLRESKVKRENPNKDIIVKVDPNPIEIVTPERRVTMWSLISGFFNDIVEMVNTSTIAGLIIPLFFIVVGSAILWKQFTPTIDEHLKEIAGYYEQGNTSPVPDAYISQRTEYLSDPGAEYFKQLSESALKRNILGEDPASRDYNGTFYITIPALGFNRLPVQANVESGIEEVYNSVLKTKLAHFKGTGLPISDVDNNIVIYGHSARDYYQPSPNNPDAAFTFISDLKIGDEITIEIEGEEHKFVMSRSKIVKPDATEIITGTPGRRTLTLFTCYPRGNNTNRLVIVANPVDSFI